MPITGIVLASGQRNEPQLTTENVLTITAGFSRLFGPTTLRQTRALTEALTTTWQQSGKKNRQREQQQVTDWIAASQRLLAGYVDDAAVVRDLRASCDLVALWPSLVENSDTAPMSAPGRA